MNEDEVIDLIATVLVNLCAIAFVFLIVYVYASVLHVPFWQGCIAAILVRQIPFVPFDKGVWKS